MPPAGDEWALGPRVYHCGGIPNTKPTVTKAPGLAKTVPHARFYLLPPSESDEAVASVSADMRPWKLGCGVTTLHVHRGRSNTRDHPSPESTLSVALHDIRNGLQLCSQPLDSRREPTIH